MEHRLEKLEEYLSEQVSICGSDAYLVNGIEYNKQHDWWEFIPQHLWDGKWFERYYYAEELIDIDEVVEESSNEIVEETAQLQSTREFLQARYENKTLSNLRKKLHPQNH